MSVTVGTEADGCSRNVTLLRAVIREDLSMAMADELVADIGRAIEW